MRSLTAISKDAAQVGLATVLVVATYYGVKALWLQLRGKTSYVAAAAQRMSRFPELRVGERIAMEKVETERDSYTVLIISSPTCAFCRDSAAFHRVLIAEAARRSIPVLLALPDVWRDKDYTSSLGLPRTHLIDWDKLGVRPRGTPAIVLVDLSGIIVKYWYGRLDQSSEFEVMNAINYPSQVTNPPHKLPSGERMLTGKDVRVIAQSQSINIVDIGERVQFTQPYEYVRTVNIPYDELFVRARQELTMGDIQIVDCTDLLTVQCSNAVTRLSSYGFSALALDNSAGNLAKLRVR